MIIRVYCLFKTVVIKSFLKNIKTKMNIIYEKLICYMSNFKLCSPTVIEWFESGSEYMFRIREVTGLVLSG